MNQLIVNSGRPLGLIRVEELDAYELGNLFFFSILKQEQGYYELILKQDHTPINFWAHPNTQHRLSSLGMGLY